MHEYDVTLKHVLTHAAAQALTQLTGYSIARWHNTEVPVIRHRRADLLGETAEGQLVHLELQSSNHPRMALRMLEYSLAIRRKFRRFPTQTVLYVGNAPLRMKPTLTGPGLHYECRFLDIRRLDAEPLLASKNLEDNVLAVLAASGHRREAVRRILDSIARHEESERTTALSELMVLAGLRNLGNIIETEIQTMPILDDIMDHEVLGRERKRGIALGLSEGQRQMRQIILTQIAKRFGTTPAWAADRLESLTPAEIQAVAIRLFDAATPEDLFS